MDLENIKPDITHDATGTFCPIPITELAKVMKQAKKGRLLNFLQMMKELFRTFLHGVKQQEMSF